jgi:hypothetical protein
LDCIDLHRHVADRSCRSGIGVAALGPPVILPTSLTITLICRQIILACANTQIAAGIATLRSWTTCTGTDAHLAAVSVSLSLNASGPDCQIRACALRLPKIGVRGRSCCSLHRATAFSPSRAARAMALASWRPSLTPDCLRCAVPGRVGQFRPATFQEFTMNNALITDEQRIVLLANGRESWRTRTSIRRPWSSCSRRMPARPGC